MLVSKYIHILINALWGEFVTEVYFKVKINLLRCSCVYSWFTVLEVVFTVGDAESGRKCLNIMLFEPYQNCDLALHKAFWRISTITSRA